MGLIKRPANDAEAVKLVSIDLHDVEQHARLIRETAERQAQRILAEARAERERIVSGAAEAGHEQGRRVGFEQGLAEGREKGRAEAFAAEQEALAALERAWSEGAEAFESERRAMLAEAKREVIALALLAAEKITKRAIELDPDAVTGQIEAALGLVSKPTKIEIAVHPRDLEIVRRALPRLTARLSGEGDVSLRGDEALDRGSCVVRPEGGVAIDASIRTQLERIAEALLPGTGDRRGIVHRGEAA
ncbi:MAG: FliH/SctL family protein [Phycisphaerales bacterium JB037]